MAAGGFRIAVVGATGALGSEVLVALDASPLRVNEIAAIATDRSLGRDVEFQGEVYPVGADASSLRGADLVFLCAPASHSLEFAREALRATVPCIDLSGALASSPEVPLRVADFSASPEEERAPLVATPPGPALAWALVLRPLDAIAPLRRVTGTALEAASVGGREGIESLYQETLAIFSQKEAPENRVFPRPVAFDCLPVVGELADDGSSEHETELRRSLLRLFGEQLRLGVTAVQVPTFVGHGAALAIEAERALDPGEAAAALEKALGVDLWQPDDEALTTRATAGRDAVMVGRLRPDPATEGGLLLWLVADLLRLSASNAVRLAVARLRTH